MAEEINKRVDDHSKRIRAVEEAIIHMTWVSDFTKEHDEILKGKGRSAGLVADVGDLKERWSTQTYWLRVIATAFIGQFAAVAVATFIFLLKVLPVILQLVERGVP